MIMAHKLSNKFPVMYPPPPQLRPYQGLRNMIIVIVLVVVTVVPVLILSNMRKLQISITLFHGLLKQIFLSIQTAQNLHYKL